MDVLKAGQKQAGHNQQQRRGGLRVAQHLLGKKVPPQPKGNGQQAKQPQKQNERRADQPDNRPALPHRLIARGDAGNRQRHAGQRAGEHHVVGRHHQIIDGDGLRARQPSQQDAVAKAQQLQHHRGGAEQQAMIKDTVFVEPHRHPPSFSKRVCAAAGQNAGRRECSAGGENAPPSLLTYSPLQVVY